MITAMSDLRDVDGHARGLARGGLGPARAVPRRPRHDAHRRSTRSSRALAARYRCVAWDMPGYGASPLPPEGSRSAAGRRRRTAHRDARRDARAPRRPLAGRPDRAAHGAPPPRARALARAARLEPGVRPRRHRSRGVEAPPPRSARRGRDAGEHRRAGAPLDHGARRRRRRGRGRRRVDVAHLGRRAARRGRVPALARRARPARRDRRARRWCSSASSTPETPLSYAEALAAGIPGHASADHPGRRPHREPGGARRREHRAARAPRRASGATA